MNEVVAEVEREQDLVHLMLKNQDSGEVIAHFAMTTEQAKTLADELITATGRYGSARYTLPVSPSFDSHFPRGA